MVASIVSTKPNPLQQAPNHWVTKMPMPMGTCDGDGFTAKPKTPQELMEASDTFVRNVAGGIKDMVKKPAKNNPNIVTTQPVEAEAQEETQKKNNRRAQIISSVILLVGGIALGYGHRNLLTKGFDAMKQKFGEWTANPTCQKIIQGGKDFIAKAKDAIFVKPQ